MKKKFKKKLIIFLILFAVFIYNKWYDNKYKVIDDNTESVVDVDNNGDNIQLKIDGDLKIYYLNVGQADSILVENDGSYMLIDAGNNVDGTKLVDYFKKMGIDAFDYVIATHAHEDHIGGIDNILNNFKVKHFYMPDVVTTSKTFEDVVIALEDNNIAFETPIVGSKFNVGECMFEVLHVGDNDDDLNDTSIVVRGVYGNNSFIFMGDATSNVEETLLNMDIDSDVLKVGHHGSKYSSAIAFLHKVTPKYAIISVGKDNSYGHPHKVSINRFRNIGSTIYRTDVDGTIVAVSDGENIRFETIQTKLDG